MARIEKTVFISYRRTDVYTALAVYENLKNQGYDVFFDYRSISSGDFEQIITSNIRARAHFLLVLTPTALDRCNEPGDWLRREIELAIDEKRNIVPLFFNGFRFGGSSKTSLSKWLPFGKPDVLTGKLGNLPRYNGLNVHEDYFDEAMTRVRSEFLNKPLDTVLHPVSTEVQKVVEEEQSAADEALKQKEDYKEPKKPVEEQIDMQTKLEELKSQAIRFELKGEFWDALQIYYEIKKIDPIFPRVDVKISELEEVLKPKPVAERAPASPVPQRSFQWQSMARVAGIVSLLLLFIWGGSSVYGNLASNNPQLTQISQSTSTANAENIPESTPTPTITSIPPTPTSALGIGSTMIGKDGMTLLYVPAGKFTMGSEDGESDEKPVRAEYLDAFWIDQTEVTNAMYAQCVTDGQCDPPSSVTSYTQDSYYRNSEFDNYPVIYVSWDDANKYCFWANRRLPTESEWEKAARGTDGRTYPWGNDAPNNSLLNYNGVIEDTKQVGAYPAGASPYGALDMAGNVWEWVDDWYDAYPGNTISNSSYGITYKVLRGGSWFSYDVNVRSSYRGWDYPTNPNFDFGFRCSRSSP